MALDALTAPGETGLAQFLSGVKALTETAATAEERVELSNQLRTLSGVLDSGAAAAAPTAGGQLQRLAPLVLVAIVAIAAFAVVKA